MADINGGEIKYTASLDISGLKNALKDGEGNIQGFSDIMAKAGEELKALFDGDIVDNLKKAGLSAKDLGSDFKDVMAGAREYANGMSEKLEEFRSQNQKVKDEVNSWKDVKASVKLELLGDASKKDVEIEEISKKIQGFRDALDSLEGEGVNLNKYLKETVEQMQAMKATGQDNTAEYIELAKKASEYSEALKEVKKDVEAMGNSAGLNVMINTLGLASGALSTVTGITSLFNDESKELQELMVKVQGTMAVTIGIQQIQNSLLKESALMESIYALQIRARAAAIALSNRNTIAATVAQRVFNMVARANPYVLLATALLTVVGALVIFSQKTNQAAVDNKKLMESIASSIAKPLMAYKRLQAQWNQLAGDLKAKEQFIIDNRDAFEDLGIKVRSVSDAENLFVENTAAFVESMQLRARAAAEMELAQEKWKEFVENEDKVAANNKRYNEAAFGGVGRWLEKKVLSPIGAGDKTVDDMNALFKSQNDLINKSIKHEQEADAKLSKAKLKKTTEKTGWKQVIQKQIDELQIAIDEAPTKQIAAKYRKKQEALQKEIDSINTPKQKKPRENNRQIAEIFPKDSIMDLERRINLYDEAIKKVQNGKVKLQKLDQFGQSKDKKGNPYYSGEVVSEDEAVKRRDELIEKKNAKEREIEYKSINDRISLNTKLWEQYYDAVNKIGIDKAKELYKGLLDQDKNYYDYLKKTQDDLLKIPVEKLSPEQKEALQTVTQAMDTMTGKIQPVEKFNNELEQTLSTFTTTAEKIQYLQKIVNENNNSEGYSNGKYSSALSRLNDEKKNLTTAYNEMYAQFKLDYQNFEVQKTQIAERWARIRSTIESRFNNGEIDNAEKLRQLNNAGQAEAEEYSKGFMDKLSNNPNYQKAFANIGSLSIKDLKNVRNKLQQELELLRKSGKGTPEAIEALKRKIQEFDYITGNKNPFEIFKDAIKALGDESVSTEDKLWKLGEAGAALSGFSNLFKSTINDIKGAAEDLGFSLDNEFGDILDKMQSMMEGFDQIGQGMQQFATGGPVGMVTGSIKMIGGLIKSISGWFNNDKKKERQIKAWASEVNNLKNAYADLEQQIKKALGEDVYKKQQEEITNLRRQQQLIQQMSAKEADKKKKDQGKIDDYNRQIQDINRQIEDIQNSITERVLQTTAKDAAKQLGDILVDNFGRAEDAAKSLEDYTNTIFKNIVKNALSMRLEEKMQPILDDMLKAVGFDKEGKGSFKPMSKEQYDEFKKRFADVAKYGQDITGLFSDMFDSITIQDPKGLEGAVKTISSQEAGELVAQFNAMRNIQGKQLDIMLQNQPTFKDILAQLIAIEFNTRKLHRIADDIADLNRKITKGSDLFMSGL
ncbi:hypothetical protein [Elizabethkingia miricola]|uniref:hypothetical protein n=1 Tax=Elizabethkingia miricola TaxID=172045 RepID=UPI000998F7D3|nr:hypothetical protein [Elizabethkingia miricola]OPC34570.1 hypothetical protein BAX99_06800 [Elizabethkingia miricola]